MFDFTETGTVLLKMVLLFVTALIVVRLMGNRTVGQLSPFDFIIMVGIGDIIVTSSMDKVSNIWGGVGSLVLLLVLQQILSYMALKNTTLRKWVEGQPVELIRDGKLIEENFVKTQFNFDDLRQELHCQGMDMSNLADIKVARLESCGDFSIIKSSDCEPMTKRDFENYIKSIYENPLSMAGMQYTRLEQMLKDIKEAAEIIKSDHAAREIKNTQDTSSTKIQH